MEILHMVFVQPFVDMMDPPAFFFEVVIGGLTTSTLITLVLIPTLYATVKEWQGAGVWHWRFNRRWVPANGRIFRK